MDSTSTFSGICKTLFVTYCLCYGLAYISSAAFAQEVDNCGVPVNSNLIWCESFETGAALDELFFDVNSGENDLFIEKTNAAHGNFALRAEWDASEIDAGGFIFTFGKSPVQTQTAALSEYSEIYWRVFVRLDANFVGQPDKLTRITIFANENWAQAMIGHVWTAGGDVLAVDPATGVDASGNLVTTKWNDFENLRWLGLVPGQTGLSPDTWHCVETHVRLNQPGQSNGLIEFWIDGTLQAKSDNLDWIGSWSDYKLNAVAFSNYWNAGSPVTQSRYLDSLAVSTARLGCENFSFDGRPSAPTNLTATN